MFYWRQQTITSTRKVIFYYFQFGLFVCQRNYGKNYTGPIFKKVEAWARAKEEPIQCWSGSKWLNTRYWKIWEKRYNCNIASSITVLYFSTCKFKFDSRKNGVLCCCRHGGTGVLHFVVNFNSVFLYFSTAAQCETKWIYTSVGTKQHVIYSCVGALEKMQHYKYFQYILYLTYVTQNIINWYIMTYY